MTSVLNRLSSSIFSVPVVRSLVFPSLVFPSLVFPSLVLAALIMVGATAESGLAGEYGGTMQLVGGSANRCAVYGPDYAVVEGTGACVRIGGHVRVQLGTKAGLYPGSTLYSGNAWGAGSASSATLRSDSSGLLPMGATSHLRIRGGLEYPDPFR